MAYRTLKPTPGERYGRLTVIGTESIQRSDGRQRTMYLVQCDCGRQKRVYPYNLQSGDTTSCGCFHAERASSANTTHGQTGTRLYRIWKAMWDRCDNSQAKNYRWYGGKGIKVDPLWADFMFFRDWAEANGYEDDLEIDRRDASGDYCPENCQWLTKRENVKRARRLISPDLEDLLSAYAVAHALTRAQVIDRALRAFLSKEGG